MNFKSNGHIAYVISNLTTKSILLVLFAISLFIRLPFFFRDYIDRDESTFILIGQSWVEGNLPYTELWDVKPPLTFLFFTVVLAIFKKSILMIRLAGTLLVALSSFYTFKLGATFTNKKIAFYSAIVCVLLQSLFGSIQGVMSEHIAMALFMPGIYVIAKYRSIGYYLFSGFLLGAALMVKLNLAYSVLLVGLYLIYYYVYVQKNVNQGIANILCYGIAILAVIFFSYLPYHLEGLSKLWWNSVIVAPLDYAEARRYAPLKLAPTFIILSIFFFVSSKLKLLDFHNKTTQLIIIALIGVLYSFYKAGRINSHYLIQLYPLLVILVSICLSKIALFKKIPLKIYIVLILLSPLEAYNEYLSIFQHKLRTGSFFNGEGITVPKYLLKNNIDTDNILFTEYHIGYLALGATPPTKASTHPSNICKDEMFAAYENPRKTKMQELRYIMENIKPKIVVTRSGKSIFDPKQLLPNEYINTYLRLNYQVLDKIEKATIYKRLEGL